MPDPLAGEADAEFRSDGLAIACHQDRKEPTLGSVSLEWLASDRVRNVLSNDGSLSHCIDSCFGREGLLTIRVGFHSDAVTAGKDIGMRSGTEVVVHFEIAVVNCEIGGRSYFLRLCASCPDHNISLNVLAILEEHVIREYFFSYTLRNHPDVPLLELSGYLS